MWRTRALAICVLLAPATSFADDTHYQDYVIGGRAAALGGAFVSLADDPSGIYYNPAGITDVRYDSLQVSASLYGFERGNIDERIGLPVSVDESLDAQFTDLIVIPASAGFIKTLGERDADGQAKHAWGVSVVVPSFRSFNVPGKGDETAIYKRRVTDRELWSGLGYGRKIGHRLSIGISGYYVLRSVVDLEDVTKQRSLSDGSDKFDSVVNDVALTNGSVLAIAGIKYNITEGLTFGAAVQSPSVQVHSTASLRFTRASSDPDAAVSTFDRLILNDADSDTGHAAALRVGLNYQRKYHYTLSADVSLHAPISYTLVDVDPAYRTRLPFDPKIERQMVVNVNVGGEYLVVREVSVAFGIFSNFSSAPAIPKNPTKDQPPRVHLLGLTMSLGYFGKHSLSRLGFVYSFGRGRDVIPDNDIDRVLEQDQGFDRVEYAQSFLYVFLSSTFRY